MRAAGLAAACLVAASCGGKPAPVREEHGRALASLVATPAGPTDLVVATVDGRPDGLEHPA